MNVLIIHAHPEAKSFTSSLKDLAVDHFTERGDNIIVSDLYKMNFNPVGVDIDFKTRSNPNYFQYLKEQMAAFQTDNFSDDLKAEMEKLLWADFILLNFPLWWSSLPAILKGWFDRVLAFGFSYHPRDVLYQTGKFKGKKAMCTITAGGSQQAYSEGGANGDIMNCLYHIHHGILYYVGVDVLPPYITWRTHLTDQETLNQYLIDYNKHLKNIESLNSLY